jgi:hypothetical protein
VTAGNVYKLAGNGSTTATGDGIAGVQSNVGGTSQMTVDPAGNVVLAIQSVGGAGTTPSLRILAASSCASSCAYGLAATTAGDMYTIATGLTSPSVVAFAGPTSILSDGSGDLFFTDGPTAFANLDELTGGPAAVPVVTGISPNAGPLGGGTLVTITSSVPNFTSPATVNFGLANPGTGVTVVSPSEITVTSPSHAAGPVDVTVATAAGTSAVSPSDVFTYQPAPTVTMIAPTSGPAAGGTPVTITGTSFLGASAVKFGVTNAATFQVNSATSITATSPAGSSQVDVTVTTASGTSATSGADLFSFVPSITMVSPSHGPAAGGTVVTITGTGFTGATCPGAGVKFGLTNATTCTVNSAISITATSPAGTGTVDITVTTPGGTSATSAADHFSYGPTVTMVSPAIGPAAGGTIVTITGSGFTGVTGPGGVQFGGTNAAHYMFNSDTSITATSPAGTGTVDITVTTPSGTSPTSAADQFTYGPTVTNVNPNSGPIAGGTVVTITGTGFTGVTGPGGVQFGGTNAAHYTFNSDTSITATSPAGAQGTVDVTVTTPAGTSPTSAADHFSYLTVPGAPTGVTGVPGNGQVTVSWNAPGNTGGTGITMYTVTASPGGAQCSTDPATTCTVTGLTNGTPYTFTVTATNSQGTGPASAPSAAVTPKVSGGLGYWIVGSDGGIFNYGDAGFFGSAGGMHLNKPVVGMAATPDGNGYWLVASDGGIFNYGDAGFFGSAGGMHLNKPIVGMAATPDGGGYWLVASDGGIFAYGDAGFFGSAGGMALNKPVVGMAATPDGGGYWLVATDGGIFAYGDANFFGSTGGMALNKPVVGMAAAPDGGGYWLVASDGGIFNYGDAGFFGSAGGMPLNSPIVGMAGHPEGP